MFIGLRVIMIGVVYEVRVTGTRGLAPSSPRSRQWANDLLRPDSRATSLPLEVIWRKPVLLFLYTKVVAPVLFLLEKHALCSGRFPTCPDGQCSTQTPHPAPGPVL